MKPKVSIPLKSASLLLLRPTPKLSFYNYQILVLERKQQLSFGSGLMFPGGKMEPTIDHQYQKKYNLKNILQSTAIRESFQQTGLYFTKYPIFSQQILDKLSQIRMEYIKDNFNGNLQRKQKYFQKISQHLTPTNNLVPFLRLITIPQLKRRYDTMFYVLPIEEYKHINFLKYAEHQKYLHNLDKIIHSTHQFNNFRWMNPAQILDQHFKKKSLIHPPQFIMLNIMIKFYKLQNFIQYLKTFHPEPVQSPTQRNFNLGPNIVSLIKNSDPSKRQTYPFAATLLGDSEFPFQKIIKHEQCNQLREQMIEWQQWQNRHNINGANRFLFKSGRQFFQSEYEVKSNIKNSVLSEMTNWTDVKNCINESNLQFLIKQ